NPRMAQERPARPGLRTSPGGLFPESIPRSEVDTRSHPKRVRRRAGRPPPPDDGASVPARRKWAYTRREPRRLVTPGGWLLAHAAVRGFVERRGRRCQNR